MSTKLTRPGARSSATASQGVKSGATLAPLTPAGQATPQNRPVGSESTSTVMTTPSTVMTREEIADLLARLQDILYMWPRSDNRIINGYVMVALPVPAGVNISKMDHKHGGKVFSVDGEPVTAVE